MLTETNNSVSDICYSCGFQSLAFFHKQFNKLKNSTPLQFRKKFLCAMDSL